MRSESFSLSLPLQRPTWTLREAKSLEDARHQLSERTRVGEELEKYAPVDQHLQSFQQVEHQVQARDGAPEDYAPATAGLVILPSGKIQGELRFDPLTGAMGDYKLVSNPGMQPQQTYSHWTNATGEYYDYVQDAADARIHALLIHDTAKGTLTFERETIPNQDYHPHAFPGWED